MEAAPAPARRLGFLRSAKAFWHPHIALMLPLGFCKGVPFGWIAALPVMLSHLEWESSLGLLLSLFVFYNLGFIWAPVFDRLPLPWLTSRLGRRRSWMLFTHVLCMASIALLGILGPSADLGTTLLLGLVIALASSSLSTVVNAYRIEILEENRYGAGEAVTSVGFTLAAAAVFPVVAASGNADIGAVAHVAAPALLLVGVAIAVFGPEPACAEEPDVLARERRLAGAAALWGGAVVAWVSRVFVAPFTEFFTRPAWLAVLTFLLLFKLGSTDLFKVASAHAEISVLTKAFGGAASFVGFVAGAMAVYVRGPLPGLVFAASLLLLSNLAFLVLDWASAESVWIGLAFGARGLGDGFGTVAVAAYAMGLCRPSYTATQFALFSAVMVFAQMAPGPRSWLAELMGERLDDMFLSVTLASLLSLLLLRVLWKRQRREKARS